MAIERAQLTGLSLSLLIHAGVLAALWDRQPLVTANAPDRVPFMQVSFITEPAEDLPARLSEVKPQRLARPEPKSRPVMAAAPAPHMEHAATSQGQSPVAPVEAPAPALDDAIAQPPPDSSMADVKNDIEGSEAVLALAASAPMPETRADPALFIQQPQFRKPPRPPVYPRLSRARGESGTVLLRALVRGDGSIAHIQVRHSSGYERLDRAAVTAARGWEIEPYRRNQTALDAWVELPVHFELRTNEQVARHP
jgi:periplasmic protein TonB